jgi:hypothetical protein
MENKEKKFKCLSCGQVYSEAEASALPTSLPDRPCCKPPCGGTVVEMPFVGASTSNHFLFRNGGKK